MTRRRSWSFLIIPALLAFGALALAACGGGDNDKTPTATAPAAETPSATAPTAGPASETTPEPTFSGGREPVEGSLGFLSGAPPFGTLVDVRAAEHETYDRIVFEFAGAPPTYRVEYVENPTACGSGEDVAVEGAALIAVSFTPAGAHTDAGEPALGFQSLALGLPAIVAAASACDFEGEVTWIVGLTEEADFRVTALDDPLRLLVDVAHPQ